MKMAEKLMSISFVYGRKENSTYINKWLGYLQFWAPIELNVKYLSENDLNDVITEVFMSSNVHLFIKRVHIWCILVSPHTTLIEAEKNDASI